MSDLKSFIISLQPRDYRSCGDDHCKLQIAEPLAKPSEASIFAKKERLVMQHESDRMRLVRTHSDRQRRAHHHVFLGRDAITILAEHTRKVVSVAEGGEVRVKPVTRLERQQKMSLEEMLNDLPQVCDSGTKLNGRGYPVYWVGYKLQTRRSFARGSSIYDLQFRAGLKTFLLSSSYHKSAGNPSRHYTY